MATRFWGTDDPLWKKHLVNLLLVGTSIPAAFLLSLVLATPLPLLVFLLALGGLIARKAFQWWRRTGDLPLGVLYALHVYLGKFPLALGAWGYLLKRIFSLSRPGRKLPDPER